MTHKRISRLMLVAAAVLGNAGLVWAQPGGAPPAPGEGSPSESRRGGARWERWRERLERMSRATAEERRQMRVDRWMRMLSRTYELTEEQQSVVRAEVDRISAERRQSMGVQAEELDGLRRQLNQLQLDRLQRRDAEGGGRPGRLWQTPEFQELRERMRAIEDQHPLDWEASVERIERLLPAEQAAAGRERRAAWMDRRRQRGDDRAARRGGRRGPAIDPADLEDDAWDRYTLGVIDKYGFDAGQANAARAILKDIKGRAQTVRRGQQEARSQIESDDLSSGTQARLRALDEPLGALFTELKTRLEGLATERQRRAPGDRVPGE